MNNQKKFMIDQVNEIEKHKWIEGEKLRKDPGDKCCLEWIKEHGKPFREHWEKNNGKIVDAG